MISIILKDWHLTIEIDILFFVILVIVLFLICCVLRNCKYFKLQKVVLDGFDVDSKGCVSTHFKICDEDKKIAQKMYIELSSRKAGKEIDLNNDVISEIYDSWYSLFKKLRELLCELNYNKHLSKDLYAIGNSVLEDTLRPHLTKWQARFRKWLKDNEDKYIGVEPQDIQKEYPKYKELVSDLLKTNKSLIDFAISLEKITRGQ